MLMMKKEKVEERTEACSVCSYPDFLLVQLSWKRCFRAVEASEFTLTTIIIIFHK